MKENNSIMSYDVSTLSPGLVWRYFDRIRRIPRGSGNERGLAEAIVSWAAARGCEAEMDAVGNTVVRIPATSGCEGTPPLILQGHLDMVCEKLPDKVFDFEKDPIQLERKDDWITASGTTLGADNGIGLATALAFMEVEDVPHGPLEILATVEEETGLLGAQRVSPDFVKGRLLFNMDSEEDGIFYVGCAGGADVRITLPTRRIPAPNGQRAFLIRVKGLLGGHSGLDIIHNRANALVLLARLLTAVSKETTVTVSSVFGGDKHNAIPRDAEATILLAPDAEEAMRRCVAAVMTGLEDEFAEAEPEMAVTIESVPAPSGALDAESASRLLCLLAGFPNGVLSMMRNIPGMVETSNNIAKVRTDEGEVSLLLSARSSIKSAVDGVTGQIEAIAGLAAAKAEVISSYPGWKPDMGSRLLAKARRVWQETHGEEAEVHVVHAGLECGLLAERFGELDMISLGPTIESPHSPSERVSISSVARFFDFTRAFIASLAKA